MNKFIKESINKYETKQIYQITFCEDDRIEKLKVNMRKYNRYLQ